MLMMATSRRRQGDGYGDEEQSNYVFDYLFDHRGGPVTNDGFDGRGKREFEKKLLAELLRLKQEVHVNTPKIGLYLHGFNNDWQASIDEAFDFLTVLTEALGYEPILVGFSWPSSGSARRYLSDREEVRDSVPAFARFLLDINKFIAVNERKCFSTSYCIAHSLGNYLLRKSMEYMSDYLGSPVGRILFNETVMLAPDLASKDIELDGKGRYIADFSRRVHVYYSKHDRALKASSIKRFGGNRLGRHGANDYGNLPGNVVVINARNFANSDSVTDKNLLDRRKNRVSVHSSHRYHPDIIADIIDVLSSHDRALIDGREPIVHAEIPQSGRPNHYRLVDRD